MIAFRKAHPSISRRHFWRDDVRWFGSGGAVDLSHSSQTLAFHLSGRRVGDSDLYVLINASPAAVSFRIQFGLPGAWRKIIDTAAEPPRDISMNGDTEGATSGFIELAPRSVVVFCQP